MNYTARIDTTHGACTGAWAIYDWNGMRISWNLTQLQASEDAANLNAGRSSLYGTGNAASSARGNVVVDGFDATLGLGDRLSFTHGKEFIMARAILLFAVCLGLLLPTPGMAARYDGVTVLPFKGSRVVVRDHLPEAWRPLVHDLIDDFNAVIPSDGPELVYEASEEVPCSELIEQPPPGVVRLCGKVDPSGTGHAYSWLNKRETAIVSAAMDIPYDAAAVDEPWARYLLCHEMMHAFTHVRDRYDSRPDTSCVWGSLNEPGAWDIAMLQALYAAPQIAPDDPKKDKQKSKHRKHKKHRRH